VLVAGRGGRNLDATESHARTKPRRRCASERVWRLRDGAARRRQRRSGVSILFAHLVVRLGRKDPHKVEFRVADDAGEALGVEARVQEEAPVEMEEVWRHLQRLAVRIFRWWKYRVA
jgi:hypothetical protein